MNLLRRYSMSFGLIVQTMTPGDTQLGTSEQYHLPLWLRNAILRAKVVVFRRSARLGP